MASTNLTRTFTAGNRKTFTISAWFKLATPDIPTSDYENIIAASGSDHGIWIREDNKLDTYWTTQLVSTNVLRDTSAWYHVVAEIDTTQATDTNRVKIYLNGEQVSLTDSSGGAAVYPTQNADTQFNDNGGTCSIGRRASTSTHYWNGSMSHFHFIDGTAYDASTFGETDSTTGIWKPKTNPSVTYGTNGFFLKFENSGSMGTDSSGNGNNLTVNGTMTQTIDTPSNVFATWDPNHRATTAYTNVVFKNGNTTVDNNESGSSVYPVIFSTLAATQGKYYMEVKVDSFTSSSITIGIEEGRSDTQYGGKLSSGIVYKPNGEKRKNDTSSSYGNSYTAGDIIGIALDLDNNYLYFSKNGTWQNSGDPTSGATGTGGIAVDAISTTQTGVYHFSVSDNSSGGVFEIFANFGNGYFGTTAVSSAQNPDDGIGIFEYDVPANYRALCTKSINAQEYS